jgi:MFS family permease
VSPLRRDAATLALLSSLQMLAYADRVVLASVLPRLEEAFHLRHAVGGLLGTLFIVGCVIASPILGPIADRGHGRALLTAGAVVWSGATMASGLARDFVSLAVCRVLVGAAETTLATIAPAMIDRVAPPDRRSRWMGHFYVAANVGVALGLALGGVVEHYAGWRGAFLVAGAPGLLLAIFVARVVPPAGVQPARPRLVLDDLATLVRNRRYAWMVAGYSAYTFAIGGFGHWAPALASRHYGVGLATVGISLALIVVLGGVGGTALGGVIGDRAARGRADGDERARALVRCCAVACSVAVPLGAAALLAPTLWAFLALLLACQLALFVTTAPINGALLHSAPARLRATSMAVALFCIHLFGDLWSPSVVGALADVRPLAQAMLVLPAALAAGAAGFWLAARRAV